MKLFLPILVEKYHRLDNNKPIQNITLGQSEALNFWFSSDISTLNCTVVLDGNIELNNKFMI